MRTHIKRSLVRNLIRRSNWPKPSYDDNDEPYFIFMLSPPNSGSTAISHILNSGNRSMLLHDNGEGQWLIPTLSDHLRWKSSKKVDYESVRSVWINKYQHISSLVSNIGFVIEKSPPNMVRFKELINVFKNYSAFVNNRNPYANVSSMFYRYLEENNGSKIDNEIIERLTHDWISRSEILRDVALEYNLPILTYENFCENPKLLLSLNLPEKLTESLNFDVDVVVKDYRAQPIICQNKKQICKLTDTQVSIITNALKEHKDLLDFYEYSLIIGRQKNV